MALTRAYEEHEVSADLRRLYAEIRAGLDLPFVPTLFKLLAAHPAYLKLVWSDLSPVARSREFQAATRALEEFANSTAIAGGWSFAEQERLLARQKFSASGIEMMSTASSMFARSLAGMTIFARLLQRGYSGGQQGRVSSSKEGAALARLMTLHVPNEREAGLRVWLIYSDIKKATGSRYVPSMFRALSPFPGYLASLWVDCKKVLGQPSFRHRRDDVAKRALALLAGLPVKDHRNAGKAITPADWRDIEDTVDSFVRLLPQIALLGAVWRRAFLQPHPAVRAA